MLLESIQDLSRYVAAEGNFQVIVDLQENQRVHPGLPAQRADPLRRGRAPSRRTSTSASSAEGAIIESADGKSVEIKLPAPQLGEANLDMDQSYVFAEERGLLNRLGDVFDSDPNQQQQVYQLAEQQIADGGPGERADAAGRGEHPEDAGELLARSATSR